ncbi:UNVERIFIED_CONTAM: hypothetical protein Scaly_1160200 [Sesamum calycinum]|uniref:Reverse transcriptase domain-containing protein n=1 Tax=Sesamum calycinum TaxID=2727403 RepID=A0AAW2Q2W6_9LAMI
MGHVALKLDLSKAYDRVEWNFLQRVLARLGFRSSCISFVLTCVSTVSYSIMLFGQKYGYLHPQRGLRQWEPLSLYLFLFCAEVISSLISSAERAGELKGVAINRGGPQISHLLFVDDTLIFCQATSEAMHYIRRILRTLEATLGLKINLEKSSIVFSKNFPIVGREDLAAILRNQVEAKHDKYLGMPAVVSRSKREIFLHLKDRVWSRLQSWKCKNLSQAGKAILLKTVIQSTRTFVMSCFLVPSSICHEIKGLMANFF